LTRLRNRLEAARERPPGIDAYPRVVEQALSDTDQLLSMFSALLRISQIEAGTRVQAFTAVNLSRVLERIYEIYLPVAEDSGHGLTCRVQPDRNIRGDEELLTQLFSNLIENAIRHTPRGTQIRLELTTADGATLASVSDTGAGVAPEDRDKVTRRFYRGSASRSSEGHGLGLALAAAIAQLHGAKLELSDAHPGLRVDLAIPTHQASAT
jgi:signal transduction histidine kinase